MAAEGGGSALAADSEPVAAVPAAARELVRCVTFNQEGSFVAVGTDKGFRIYRCDPFGKLFEWNKGGIGAVEMLFTTSLVALVSSKDDPRGSPRQLRLFNAKRDPHVLKELDFASAILAVRMNRSRLVVVLERRILVHDIKTLKSLTRINTAANPLGVCALSANHGNCLLAFPASAEKGDIVIYDAANLQVRSEIPAHQSPVRCVAFNGDGTRLATMSEKGTVVRVFSVPDGRKLRTFRRGAQAVAANCLSFNSTSTLLAVSSASSTVHIFNMQDPQESAGASGARGQAGGVVGVAAAGAEGAPSTGSAPLLATAGAAVAAASSLAKSLTARVTAMLPEKVQDMVEPSWHFAYVDMKDQTNLYCSFMGPSTVIVTTEGGFLYRFSVPAVGGACKLDSEHALFATGDDSQTQLLYAVRGAPDEEDAVRFEEDEAQQ